MRTRSLIVSVAILSTACGCAATPAPAPGMAPAELPAAEPAASARTEVRLKVGETAPVDGAGFEVTFDAVEGDSRCAKGETCVWEGSAAVRLTINGATGKQEIVLHTSQRGGPGSVAHQEWVIGLAALEPQPVTGHTIPPTAYVATIAISRGSDADVASR